MARRNNRLVISILSKNHAFWYRLFGGAGLTGDFGRGPVLLLTTTGRKSGKLHTTPLIYGREGDEYIVIASNNGDDRDPGWWRNLKVNPRATILVKRSALDVSGEQASAADTARLWPLMTAIYPGYDAYKKGTSRDIPLILLKPVSPTPSGR